MVLRYLVWQIIAQGAGLSPLDDATLAEKLAAIHLVCPLANTWASFGYMDGLYYWRSQKGKEVDFVYYPDQEGKPFGVEVKYQGRISGCDEQSITKGIDRGILVTRNDFKWAGYVRFRYGLFCPYLSDSAKNALSAG